MCVHALPKVLERIRIILMVSLAKECWKIVIFKQNDVIFNQIFGMHSCQNGVGNGYNASHK